MEPFQKMVGDDGYEVMLFPLTGLYVSQGENGSFSHQGILAIDFLGWYNNTRLYDAPMYAPCSCRCVATISSSNHGRIFQSLNLVHTPNGLQYVTWVCMHDENPIASVGDTFQQGEIFAHTGTYGPNVTGDHTHFNTAYGTYAGWHQVPPANHGELINSSHIYETCYVNDTDVTSHTGGYTWVEYSGGHTPTETKKHRFPWVLYARKLRNNRMSRILVLECQYIDILLFLC